MSLRGPPDPAVEPQLPADHLRLLDGPGAVIADQPPLVGVEHLEVALVGRTAAPQPHPLPARRRGEDLSGRYARPREGD